MSLLLAAALSAYWLVQHGYGREIGLVLCGIAALFTVLSQSRLGRGYEP